MPAIPSAMKALSSKCPEFSLPEVTTQKTLTRDELIKGKQGLLVMFICAHCPYVIHIQKQITQLGKDFQTLPITMVAISSNDATKYPDDSPEKLAEQAKNHDFVSPIFTMNRKKSQKHLKQRVHQISFYTTKIYSWFIVVNLIIVAPQTRSQQLAMMFARR